MVGLIVLAYFLVGIIVSIFAIKLEADELIHSTDIYVGGEVIVSLLLWPIYAIAFFGTLLGKIVKRQLLKGRQRKNDCVS